MVLSKLNPKYQFINKVATLSIGNIIAQAVPFLLMPFLTRLYSPNDFGVFAIFVTLVGIFSELVTGKYEMAILLPKNEIRAISLVKLTIIISFILSFILLLIIILFHDLIIGLLGSNQFSFWIYLIPLATFLNGSYETTKDFCLRKNAYSNISKSIITKSISGSLFQFLAGLGSFAVGGLITGNIISYFTANLSVFRVYNKTRKSEKANSFSFSYCRLLLHRYKNFPKFAMPSSVLNSSSAQIIVIALSAFYSTTIVGFYSLAQKILNIPTSLLGSSIRQVYFKEASEHFDNKKYIRELTWKLYQKLIYIGVIPMTIILVFGPEIFGFVFGKNWSIAGHFAQMLSIWFLLIFAASPISALLIVLEKQKSAFVFQLISFIMKLAVLSVCYLFRFNEINTILLFAIISALSYQSLIIYIFYTIGVSIRKTLLFTVSVIISGIVIFKLLKWFIS